MVHSTTRRTEPRALSPANIVSASRSTQARHRKSPHMQPSTHRASPCRRETAPHPAQPQIACLSLQNCYCPRSQQETESWQQASDYERANIADRMAINAFRFTRTRIYERLKSRIHYQAARVSFRCRSRPQPTGCRPLVSVANPRSRAAKPHCGIADVPVQFKGRIRR